MLSRVVEFYTDQIGCRIWQDQDDCIILKHGNLLFGFCERDGADVEGLITFFYESREEVDRMYEALASVAVTKPQANDKYEIYQFFASDPEGRKLEFQYFENRVEDFLSADELLMKRRSVRRFRKDIIPGGTLDRLFEICRHAPTSHNTQSYYFKLITDRFLIDKLAATRGGSSAPIGRAPMAVAIVSDPGLSQRPVQDGCIAAYHFLLAARSHGLGTCWIAAMDREDVKEMLEIPSDHYVATVTPLGYPENWPEKAPGRKDRSWFVRV